MFDCDHCGACCTKLIVEADWLDASREARLLDHTPLSLAELRKPGRAIKLYEETTRACPFWRECRCAIYPTRPNECVAVQPGDAKCQQARHLAGLALLLDREWNLSHEALRESCMEYGLELEDLGLAEN